MVNYEIDHKLFEDCKHKVLLKQNEPHGFGTLKEKTLHSIMKLYYAPNEDFHEIPIEGYIADIFTGEEIIEVQNGNFYKMREKLKVFLKHYDVYIIYPVPKEKWLIWIDEETGQISKRHKSPAKGSGYSAFKELYRIKQLLTNERLHIRIPLINMEEYRMLNGWSADKKRGSTRYDRMPVSFEEQIVIDSVKDYVQFVPYELESFTSLDLAKSVKIKRDLATLVLNILWDIGVVERIGKKGNSYLYKVKEEMA